MTFPTPNQCKLEYMNPPRGYVALSSVVCNVAVKSGKQVSGIYVTERKNVGDYPHDKSLDLLGVQLWTFEDVVRVESDSGFYNSLDKVFLWDGNEHHSVNQMKASNDIRACHQYLLSFGVMPKKFEADALPKNDPGWDVVAERVMLQQAVLSHPRTSQALHTWPSPILRNRGNGLLYIIGHAGTLMQYDGEIPAGGK